MAEEKAPSKKKEDEKPPSKILPCGCKHEFQDHRYGVGNRVHNWRPKGTNISPKRPWPEFRKHGRGYACTVCGHTKGD